MRDIKITPAENRVMAQVAMFDASEEEALAAAVIVQEGMQNFQQACHEMRARIDAVRARREKAEETLRVYLGKTAGGSGMVLETLEGENRGMERTARDLCMQERANANLRNGITNLQNDQVGLMAERDQATENLEYARTKLADLKERGSQ